MTDKLSLYNDAMLHLGEERLASLSEASVARYALDDAYSQALKYCLEQGFWNFAIRAVQVDSSASVVPTFGYTYAFTMPSDFIRLYQISENEDITPPLTWFTQETVYWYANCDPLFVAYVSDDTAYGGDLSNWPQTFAEYVGLRLANRTCKRITGDAPSDHLVSMERKAKGVALSKDAMNGPIGFPPVGTWVNSRVSGISRRSRWDRNSP